MQDQNEQLRRLPSVDKLAQSASLSVVAPPIRLRAARAAVDQVRAAILAGANAPDVEVLATQLALVFSSRSLRPIINMSGVILHTGLGRARLALSAAEAVFAAAGSHCSVELDLADGKRGDRQDHVRELLCRLTGAEDAFVVNNCAAAVLLALSSLCAGRDVVLSRGQMVEIGGSFRMPDIVKQSGCRLVEVGCTNKTHLRDYADALTPETAAILQCHRSNFKVIGFTSEPPATELAGLAHENGALFIDDMGSGCLVDTTRYGLPKEPTLDVAVANGADVVVASGDKLLGGPQAGIMLGSKRSLGVISSHPLARAVRIDKLTLAGLEATLRLYDEGREDEIPVWKSLSRNLDELKEIACALAEAIPIESQVVLGETEIGGGSLPGQSVPTWRVGLVTEKPDAMLAQLRNQPVAIIGRIEDNVVWLDPRTLEATEVEPVKTILKTLTEP